MSTEQKDVLSTEPKQLNSTNLHKSFDSLTFEKKFVRPEISLQGEDFQSQTIPKEIADEIKDEEVSMAGGQPKYDIPDSIVTHAPRTFEILTPDSLHENSFFSSMNQTHISAATTNDKQSIYTGNIQQGIQDNKPLRDKCVNGDGGQAPALYLSLPAWQAHRLKNFRESNVPNFSFIDSPSTNRSFEESYEHMETKLQNKSRQNDLNYSMAPSTQPCLSVRNHLDSPDEDSRHIAERQRASPAQMSPDWDKSLSNNQILEEFEEANKDQIRVFIVEEEKVENKSPGRTAGKQGIDVMETEFDGIECARGITQTFAAQPSNSDMNRKASESHEPPLKRQRSQSRAENNPELEQTDTISADVANELINYEEDNSRSMVAQASSELDSDMPLNNIPDHPSAASSSTSLHPPMGYYTRYTPPPPFLENTSEGGSQTPTDPLAPQVSPPPYDQITQQFTSEGLHANTYIPNGHANFISTRQSIVGSPPNLSGRHAHFAGFSQPQTGSSSNNCSSSEPDRTKKPQTHNLLQDTASAQANGQYINMEQSATSKHVTHASNTTSCVTHRSPPLPHRIMSPQRQLNQIKQQPRVTLPGTLTASNPPRRSMPQPFQPSPYLIPVGVVGQSPPSDPHYINPDLERGCFQLGFRPQNSRRLQDELRQLPGWCPNVNGSNINEAIKNIVHGDGNFIIWRSRRHNNFVITLSHHGHPIYLRVREAPPRSRGGGPVYYLYEDEFHSESILALVQHYRERGVHVKIIAQHSGRSHIEHIRLRRPLQF